MRYRIEYVQTEPTEAIARKSLPYTPEDDADAVRIFKKEWQRVRVHDLRTGHRTRLALSKVCNGGFESDWSPETGEWSEFHDVSHDKCPVCTGRAPIERSARDMGRIPYLTALLNTVWEPPRTDWFTIDMVDGRFDVSTQEPIGRCPACGRELA